MNAKNTAFKVIEYSEKILKYMDEVKTVEEFEKNELLIDAVMFNLIQIGERCKHPVMRKFRTQYDTIPWNDIKGLRNRLVHEYEKTRYTLIWDIIKNDLEPLLITIKTILKP